MWLARILPAFVASVLCVGLAEAGPQMNEPDPEQCIPSVDTLTLPMAPCEQADQVVDSPGRSRIRLPERTTATVRERLRPLTDTRTCTSVATGASGSSCQPGPTSLPVSALAGSVPGYDATSGPLSKRQSAASSAGNASSIPNTQPAVSATGVAGLGPTAPVWHPGGPCP